MNPIRTEPVKGHPAFDQNYPLLLDAGEGDSFDIEATNPYTESACVRLVGDDTQEMAMLESRVPGDYMRGTPSIALQVKGVTLYFNWAEAYNIGQALIRLANVAHYG